MATYSRKSLLEPEDLAHDNYGGKHGSRQAWRHWVSKRYVRCTRVCVSLHTWMHTHRGLRDWEWHRLLKSESPPAVTHFLQQDYTP